MSSEQTPEPVVLDLDALEAAARAQIAAMDVMYEIDHGVGGLPDEHFAAYVAWGESSEGSYSHADTVLALIERLRAAEAVTPEKIAAGIKAHHDTLHRNGMGWTDAEDWAEERRDAAAARDVPAAARHRGACEGVADHGGLLARRHPRDPGRCAMSLDDALKRLRSMTAGEAERVYVRAADLREVLEHHAGLRAIVEGPDLAAGSLLGEQIIVTNPGSGRQWAGYGCALAWHPTIVIQDGNGFQRTLPLAWARRAADELQPSPAAKGRWIYGVRDVDGDVYSFHGTWDPSPFDNADDARDAWGHVEGATLVRAWKAEPAALEWEEVSP